MKRVQVVVYDPNWITKFREEAKLILTILGDELLEMHHIGSTAIPGIFAKPVIDILPVVRSIENVNGYNPQFVEVGYEPRGEYGLPGRRYFSKDEGEEGKYHIHMYQIGNPEIERHLAFRDYMMSHPKEALAYSNLKVRLTQEFPSDIDAYMDGKDSFVKERERRALVWKKKV